MSHNPLFNISTDFPPAITSALVLHLLEGLRRVALVRSVGDAVLDLGVRVRGENDEPLGIVDDGPGGEAVAGAELPAPTRGDAVGAARDGVLDIRLAGGAASDDVAAASLGRGAGVGVNREADGARRIGRVAGASKALNGPLRDGWVGGHSIGGSSDGHAGGGDEAEDGSNALHFDRGSGCRCDKDSLFGLEVGLDDL